MNSSIGDNSKLESHKDGRASKITTIKESQGSQDDEKKPKINKLIDLKKTNIK